jgi:hypothetical protein
MGFLVVLDVLLAGPQVLFLERIAEQDIGHNTMTLCPVSANGALYQGSLGEPALWLYTQSVFVT